jgi:hypothetical protein
MATEEREMRRPYAAPSNITAVLKRTRTRNLPEIIDGDFITLSGVPAIVIGRVMEGLRFIGAIREDGRPTDDLRAISAASDEEYRDVLANMVRRAYQEDFERINPAEDTQAAIVGAFRRYEPRSQTARMVMLFLGLCREAGIPVLDAPRERQMRQSTRVTPRTVQAAARAAGGARAGARSTRQRQEQPPAADGLLFGLTEEDVAVLGETEFNEVWAALGKVARARARARQPVPQRDQPTENPVEGTVEPTEG